MKGYKYIFHRTYQQYSINYSDSDGHFAYFACVFCLCIWSLYFSNYHSHHSDHILDFIILSEFLLNIHYNKLRISEIHSTFTNRVRGESSVSRKEIINSLIGLLKLYKMKIKMSNQIKKNSFFYND